MDLQGHVNFLRQTANNIDSLLSRKDKAMGFFEARMKIFEEMRVDWNTAREQAEADPRNQQAGQPKEDCIWDGYYGLWRPKDFPPDPLEWIWAETQEREVRFETGKKNETKENLEWVLPTGSPTRDPTDDEKLTCDYFLLTVVHDGGRAHPTDKRIYFDTVNREPQQDCVHLWKDLNGACVAAIPAEAMKLWEHLKECNSAEIRDKIGRALKHVKADLETEKPVETGQNVILSSLAYARIFRRLEKQFENLSRSNKTTNRDIYAITVPAGSTLYNIIRQGFLDCLSPPDRLRSETLLPNLVDEKKQPKLGDWKPDEYCFYWDSAMQWLPTAPITSVPNNRILEWIKKKWDKKLKKVVPVTYDNEADYIRHQQACATMHTEACNLIANILEIEKPAKTRQGNQGPHGSGKITKLTDFILNNCEDTSSISSKANRIHEFVKQGKILFMPKPINEPEGNQTKLYDEEELRKTWPQLKLKIKSLPNLKA